VGRARYVLLLHISWLHPWKAPGAALVRSAATDRMVVALQVCGLDPPFAGGGNLYETGKNAHLGTGEIIAP
jgi:hypothetical protein